MLAHKHITKIVAVVMAAAVCLCLCAVAFSGPLTAWAGDKGIAQEYETALFDTSSILSVNIQMDEADWNDMLENAMAETYYQCNVEVNGTMFYQVGIRPKGNTSLSAIANDDTTDRYSFKLEFDHYVDGQTCFGLDKLILNNNYADATNLKEALIYDMYQYLGADASLYNYAKISVNGEYWGVYLALEGVEDSFQLRNYGTESGELYKPESMDMGGGKAQERPDGMPEGDAEQPGGMDRNSGGADLNYTDDDLDSYETIWDGEVTKTNQADHERVVKALKNIAEGNDLENETYHSQYEAYLQQLVSEYINGGGFDAFYERVRSQIDELVETDPTAFYSYDEYETAAETLYQVVKLRGQSIQGQLDGTIPSTEEAQRDSDALVDASDLDLSVMGTMNMGGGDGKAPAKPQNESN